MVAVSLLPQKYFVERIAGDSLAVHLLVPSGDNPEHFDPHRTTLPRYKSATPTLPWVHSPLSWKWIEMLQGSEVEVVNIATEPLQELIFGGRCRARSHPRARRPSLLSSSGGKAMATTIYQHLTQLLTPVARVLYYQLPNLRGGD